MKKPGLLLILNGLIILGLLVLLAFILPISVLAQDETPPAASTGTWKGQVMGSITNGTPGASLPEKVEVMLHGWNGSEEKIMLHDQSTPDGSFQFSDVDFDPGLYYSVMATYEDVAYVSEPAQVKAGDLTLRLNTPVFETTNDLSQAKIDQMHALFYAHEGELMVTEVYVLSNTGNRTIKDALALPSGRKGTVKYPLPDDATGVEFDSQSSDRFIQVEGGFVDSAPLVPGEKNSQVMVRFNLPYTGKYSFDFTAPVAIGGISFLIRADSGLKLQNSSLTPAGTQSMQDGSTFSIYTSPYTSPGLDRADTIRISLTGKLNNTTSKNSNQGIAIGGGLLGLALLGVGIWWWRRPKSEGNTQMSMEAIFTESVYLDEAYASGEVSEEEYLETRARLEQVGDERNGNGSELI